jgi:predicted membrane GTPase involved in stress response
VSPGRRLATGAIGTTTAQNGATAYELVEVTPEAIRLSKRLLDASDRKRASRTAAAE